MVMMQKPFVGDALQRPLYLMTSKQEKIYQAGRKVSAMADYLSDQLTRSSPIEESSIIELVKHLDLAVEEIRQANGGCA